MDSTLLAIAISMLAGWGIWVTRKLFEAHECNRVLKGTVNEAKTEIKVELEVLKERINNLIERLS